MKIVIEYVLIANFLINLITLKTVELLLRDKGKLVFLSAFLGACMTVVVPLLGLTKLGIFMVEIGQFVVLICLSFKFKGFKKFFQIFLTYFISIFVYGGAAYMLENLFGIKSVVVLLGIIFMVYVAIRFLTKRQTRKKNIENFCFDIEIDNMGQTTKWKAFLDTGNMLFDPITESPVTLINYKVFSTLFKDLDIEDILTKSAKLKKLKFAHYINFNTLNNSDKILVFQVDKLKANGGKIFEKATLGLSLKNFNQAFGTDVILHNNFAS